MQLPLFPRAAFDQSVTTPVLLGVLVSWFFTETFGWVFAGLVVPGYLASVFLLDPAGAVIDVAEAVVTYGVARVLGEHLPRIGITSRVFGRERFFLVVLVSVLVRLAFEGWALPLLAPQSTWAYSVGLVVVPLAANACWKTGLFRGVVQNGVPTLIVFLLLRYVLVPYTNLSLAGFELATENVAASFLGSPKAYILLLTGALLAAAANVRYGWDYNGILVPALLGLTVVEPTKLVATFIEAALVYGVVLLLIRITPLKRANIEGQRRLVLFFTVDYALRFAFAGILGSRMPGGDIVSFMGFGYLLPTLLAVKVSQKASAPLVLLPAAKVTAAGFLLGSFVGFGAQLVDRSLTPAVAAEVARPIPSAPTAAPAAALWVSALAQDGLAEPDTRATGDLRAIADIAAVAAKGDLARARAASLEPQRLDGDVVLLRERFERMELRKGIPSYLVRAKIPEAPLVALVPAPLASPAAAAAAGTLVAQGDVDAVIVAGIEEPESAGWLETTAHAAARAIAGKKGSVLVVRDHAAPDKRPANVLDRVTRAASRFPKSELRASGDDLVLVVDGVAVGAALAPQRTPVPLESAAAMTAALEHARKATSPMAVEYVVAMRRLVLEPLLSPAADTRARELAPFAATAFGYRLSAPSPWIGGGLGVALLPVEDGCPLAVLTRTTGVKTTVVEASVAAHRGVRDFALRLAAATSADAVILGSSFEGGMRRGAVRAAHAAATEVRGPTVFFVREDPAVPKGIQLASWMDDGKALPAARAALDALGTTADDVPADLLLRELATRTLLQPTPLVSFAASPEALTRMGLDDARRALERLAPIGIGARDGDVRAAARGLAKPLLRDVFVDPSFADTVRAAAGEGSVVASLALARELSAGSARAVVVRAAEGTYLVALGRAPRELVLVTARIDPGPPWKIERRTSITACFDAPLPNGACSGGEP
jgi:hypothetical protein